MNWFVKYFDGQFRMRRNSFQLSDSCSTKQEIRMIYIYIQLINIKLIYQILDISIFHSLTG